MTVSNKLTISRIILTFIFMFFLFSRGILFKSLALIVFIAASFSDYLDGYLAKRRKEITNFGKFMDPLADKILTLAAFLAFVEMKLIPAWMVVIIIARELVITGLRLTAFARREVIEAGLVGKHKTISQFVSIIIILVFILFREAGVRFFRFWNPSFEYWYRQIIFIMMFVTVCLTVISGISYILNNKKYLKNG